MIDVLIATHGAHEGAQAGEIPVADHDAALALAAMAAAATVKGPPLRFRKTRRIASGHAKTAPCKAVHYDCFQHA